MENKVRYTLTKEDRLKSRKLIEQLFKEGKSFSIFPFRIIYLTPSENKHNPLQAGFSVSAKNFKKAVDRNRIKRLVKEAYRLQKNDLSEYLKNQNKVLTVFFIYTGREIPEYKIISGKMQAVLTRLQKIMHEELSANI